MMLGRSFEDMYPKAERIGIRATAWSCEGLNVPGAVA